MFVALTLGKVIAISAPLIIAVVISRTRDKDAVLFFITFWLSMGILKDSYILIGIAVAMLLLFRGWIVAFLRQKCRTPKKTS